MERDISTVGSETGLGPHARGVDAAFLNRPGVPAEREPSADPDASWEEPERQPSTVRHLKRKGLARLTPVYGTAQPPKGLSGVMREAAYDIPEHKPSHWMLLMAADRVDVLEHRLRRLTSSDGALPVGREIRSRPWMALAAAGVAGVLLAKARRG